ncbi:phosphopantetheine-binding protein, partial [Streptomyces sp.]|uniref:phosphopantetheine-binding protein n=2 Tax=Streptomyces sp. TaxID=1931 RepID=UPI0028117EE2
MNPTSSGNPSGNPGTSATDRTVLLSLAPAERIDRLGAYLRERYERITGREGPADPDEPLFLESLQATEFQLTVESEMGTAPSLTELVGAPTLRELTALVETRLLEPEAAGGSAVVEISADEGARFEPFGLTDVQHAYWLGRSGLFELGDVSTHLYLELASEDFDLDRAHRVIRRLIGRHDMLRAIVRPDGRQQILASVPDFTIGYEDLTGHTEQDAEAAVAALRETLSHEVRPADRWPLFDL